MSPAGTSGDDDTGHHDEATSPDPLVTPAQWLAERCRRAPHQPWLFYRDGLDWVWRSWRRVADQVMRGATALREEGFDAGDRLAFLERQDPDSIAACLAIESIGAVAVAIPENGTPDERTLEVGDAWISVRDERPSSVRPEIESSRNAVLPPALSALSRSPRAPLQLTDDATDAGVLVPTRAAPLPARKLTRAARHLDRRLPASSRRAILCAAPNLDPAFRQLLRAWTLTHDAAWVLEPLTEAFLPTVLWARPTHVAAGEAELGELTSALGVRRHRRRSRIRTVIAADATSREPWQALGVDVVALGQNPLQSPTAED